MKLWHVGLYLRKACEPLILENKNQGEENKLTNALNPEKSLLLVEVKIRVKHGKQKFNSSRKQMKKIRDTNDKVNLITFFFFLVTMKLRLPY